MAPTYTLFVVIFLVCLLTRTIYETLKEAGRIDPRNKPIFLIILTVMICLWVSWFGMCPLDPVRINLPVVARWTGFVSFAVGLFLALGALFQLRGVENIGRLVTTGLFSRMRHPMYVGFVLWIIGWSVYHGALISLGAGVIGIVQILYWKEIEEKRLLIQFGEAYSRYRSGTWF